MRTQLAPCPIGRHPRLVVSDGLFACPTQLQPYRGRLTEGITQHLRVVHEIPEDHARSIATDWVAAGCRDT